MPKDENICEDLRKDLLQTLKEIKKAIDDKNPEALKELSDHTIHCSTIYQDKRAIYIAMIAYSLYKIIEKGDIQRKHGIELNEFISAMSENVGALVYFLEEKEIDKFDNSIKNILKEILDFDSSFGAYVKNVLDFAKAKKGVKIYEHGLSLSSVADMLGVSKWELMQHIGETRYHEEIKSEITPRDRLNKLKKIIGEE
jgi:hypothetical protein